MTRAQIGIAVAVAAVCGLLGSPTGAGASPSSPTNAAQATPLVWWALGDSYSSGEGIAGTEPKAKGAKKDCSRASGFNTSAKAWAVVAKEQLAEPRIKSWAFVPCTGAISSEVAGQIGEAKAASKVDKADIVTFSMGGNDILFPDVIKGCLDVELTWGSFVPGCDDDENTLRQRVDMLVGSRAPAAGQYVGETLPKLYDRVASNVRSGGAVVVLGYPQLIEEVGRWSGWRRNTLSVCKGILERDVPMLRSVAGYLNEQIAIAVQAANKRWSAKGVRFFWRDIATGVYEKGDAPAQRHGLCSDTPWINGVTVGWSSGDAQHERSFHPKQEGHTDTGEWLGPWMRSSLKVESMNKPKPAAPKDGAPGWDLLKSASIPEMCAHPPTKLVNGKDVTVGPNEGRFELLQRLDNGQPGFVQGVPSNDAGPLTAVVASCNAGGVGWPNPILFFSAGAKYYGVSWLGEESDWAGIGLLGAGRDGVQIIELRDGQVVVFTSAERPDEPACCPSAFAEARLRSADGQITMTSLVEQTGE